MFGGLLLLLKQRLLTQFPAELDSQLECIGILVGQYFCSTSPFETP